MRTSKHHPTRKLYTSELDLPDEHIKPFFDWYAWRHAPDIYQIGFEVCTSYRGIEGDMAIFDLYEINTVDVFDTAKYRAVSANDPYSGPLLAYRKAKAHSIYSQLYVAPEPEDSRPLLNCDWLRVDRFDAAQTDTEALCNYLDAGEAERVLLAGAKRIRLAKRTKAGPKHVSHRPPYMILSEWAERPALSDIGPRLAATFGNDVSNQSVFVGYRLYPWADRPDLLPG
jgi:hypothetical protein